MTLLRPAVVLAVLAAVALAPLRLAGQVPRGISDLDPSESPAVEQSIGDLIRSSDLKDQTWGAYLAGKLSLNELLPDLERLLDRQALGSPLQEKWLTSAILDALIQARAAVPPNKLLLHREQFPDQVLILLALHPHDNAALLLSLLDEPLPDIHRQLLRGTLAQARAPGFVAHLLRGYRVVATVYVRNPGSGGVGRGGGAGSSTEFITGCTLGPELPADYPPGVCYGLGGPVDAQPGASVLMALPAHPIYYTRTEVAPGIRAYPAATRPRRTERFDGETTDYLAVLLHQPKDQLPIREYSIHHVEWHGVEDYIQQIKGVDEQGRASFTELLAQLAQAELLTEGEDIPRRPLLEWQVIDLRENMTEPIPAMK